MSSVHRDQHGYPHAVWSWPIVAGVVTRIHPHGPRRLYLREHREAKRLSAVAMAGRLGIERESVYRQEREWRRVDPAGQIKWAHALGLDDPGELWSPPRPPERPSLDAMAVNASDDTYRLAVDIVRRLVANAKK